MSQNEIFREIEEDLERQRYEALWKRYGPTLIAIALIAVIATAVFSAWQAHRLEGEQKVSGELIDLLKKDELDPAKQAAALDAFAASRPGTVQSVIARLHAASQDIKVGNREAAAKLLESVAGDKSVAPMFRQYASLTWIELNFDSAKPADLQSKLEALAQPDQPWRYTASELLGHLALRTGEKAKSREIFAALAQDARVPPALADRAAAMSRYLED